MKILLITLFTFISSACLIAQDTLRVPSGHSSIQQAINASTDGDIILVAPGTYLENINFKGKNILVTSHFILNDDLEYIKNTIIDGGNPDNPDSASCVSFHSGEDSSAVIQGFTITGGTGTKWVDPNNPGFIWRGGGGVFTFMSSPTIKNNIIINNNVTNTSGVNGAQGGGTLSYNGNPQILNNIIMLNEARYGAGIVIDYSGGIIKNNIIYKNTGGQDYGGGGFWSIGNGSSPIIVENNHIVENSVSGSGTYGGKGGAMFVWMGTVTARNNIVWGNTQSQGGPIAEIDGGNAVIRYSNVEDGFTGTGNINLDPEFTNPNLYLDQSSPCIDTGNPNQIYNDPEDPVNSGFAEFPSMGNLRNDMGAYGGHLRAFFPLFISENLLNQPESAEFDSTHNLYLVSNYGDGSVVQINANGTQDYFITGLGKCLGNHIAGNTLYVSVKDYSGVTGGVGVLGINLTTAQIEFSVAITSATTLDGIASDTSGYLYVIETSGKIFKIAIGSQNYSLYISSGLAAYPQDCIYDEANNRLIVVAAASYAPIQSVNLEDSTISTVVVPPFGSMDGITIDQYRNIYLATHQGGCVYRYESAFNNPPQLISSGHNGPAGPHYNKRDNILAVPNFYSNSVDLIPVSLSSVEEEKSTLTELFELYQNYPNPFNPVTNIKYEIPQSANASLKVYDVLGNEIVTLINEEKPAGSYQIEFDGVDLPSGIYFYQLKSNSYINTKKMVLSK
ncbi:MAG: T9SS type A sorting domain-containing protein [Ignavibacteriaceae bacterium]|nr:T9SS type A sorting domain-containing protein [Ignavibacteriaceae bacterium]